MTNPVSVLTDQALKLLTTQKVTEKKLRQRREQRRRREEKKERRAQRFEAFVRETSSKKDDQTATTCSNIEEEEYPIINQGESCRRLDQACTSFQSATVCVDGDNNDLAFVGKLQEFACRVHVPEEHEWYEVYDGV